jgi:hypothetical protein
MQVDRFKASISATALAAAIAISWSAHAQTANSYVTPQKPLIVGAQITSTAAANVVSCSTNPCLNGAIIESVLVSLNDTSAHLTSFYLCTASCPQTTYLLGVVSIPANTGSTSSVPPVNIFSNSYLGSALPQNNNGNKYLFLPAGAALVAVDANSTSSKPQNLTSIGAAY